MELFNSKLINYYLRNDKSIEQMLRYNFDNLLIGKKEVEVANNYIRNSKDLIEGKDIEIFHENISNYIGTDKENIYSFYSAHAGICFLLAKLKNIHPNKEYVIVPAFTCSVVVNAITSAGLKPIFVDIELDTYGVSSYSLKRILNENSEKVLLVIIHHLFGLVSRDYEELLAICRSKKLLVMADCSQSLGTFYKDRSIGVDEDFSIFSMQASKSINTYTGGILVVNNNKYIFKESYNELDNAEDKDVKKILKSYRYQYLMKSKNKYILPIFSKIHRKDIISSLHKSENNNNKITKLQGSTLIDNYVYVRKYPNVLAKIANIQLSKLENTINFKLNYFDEFLSTYNEKIYIKKNSRPALTRIPIIRDYKYKSNVRFENGYIVGNWFCYYFGVNNKNAKYAAYNLVNYLKVDKYE